MHNQGAERVVREENLGVEMQIILVEIGFFWVSLRGRKGGEETCVLLAFSPEVEVMKLGITMRRRRGGRDTLDPTVGGGNGQKSAGKNRAGIFYQGYLRVGLFKHMLES